MTHNAQLKQAKIGNDYDFSGQFKQISPFLKNSDFVAGNFESTSDKSKNFSSYPAFNTPPQIFKSLKNIGFKALSVSNNHSLDMKISGLKSTLKEIKKANLKSFGSKEILIQEIKNLKFGFLAYSYGFNGFEKFVSKKDRNFINFLDEKKIKKDIKNLRSKVDFIVVYPHWGDEYSQKANDFQKKLAKKMINFGADFVIGNHPHTTQEAFYYCDKRCGFVAFSLGNFISNQRYETLKNYGVERSLAVEILFKNSQISQINFHPLWVGKIENKIQVFLAKDYKNKNSKIYQNKRAKKAYFDTLNHLDLKILHTHK